MTLLSLGTLSAASLLHAAPVATSGKYFDYSVTIIMENNDLPSVLSEGTYQANLANQYTLSTGYSGVAHPSEPNYSVMIGGHISPNSDDGICCGQDTSVNLVDRLESEQLTWTAFAEGLSDGDCSGSGVDTDHLPFLFFSDIVDSPARCSNMRAASPGTDSQLITALNSNSGWPNYIWLTPDTSNDAHDTSIAFGDRYLAALVPQILSSTLFQTQRAALFIVYDEGNDVQCSTGGQDCIYASWSGPVTKRGFTSSNPYDHYSYLHTIEDNWALAPLTTTDAVAPVMAEFFTALTGPTPLSASFTTSPTSAQAGQTVTFTAIPTGGIAPYSETWEFGDGATGSGATASHAYSNPGSFQVRLTAQDSASPVVTVTLSKTLIINPAPVLGSLSLSVSSNPNSPTVGQLTSFTASVTGGTPPYGVGWDFGDGSISVGPTTTHTFSTAGTFNVTVAVTDSSTPAQTKITSVFVTVQTVNPPPPPSPLSAQFSFHPSSPTVDTTVSLASTVSGGTAPYDYAWDFGDSSGTDTVANPTYIYTTSGTFTITLTITDSTGDTTSVSHEITVAPTPPPPPSGTSGQYCTPLTQGQTGDLQPILAVDYIDPTGSVDYTTTALFDTGSSYSVAPPSLATALGLKINDGIPVTLTSVSGAPIQAYLFHLTLNFGGTLQVTSVPVAITHNTDQFLIGRIGFLNQVGVTIEPSGQTICFAAVDPPNDRETACTAGALDGDGDYDGDHCGETWSSGSNDYDGSSGTVDFVGVINGSSGGAISGIGVLFTAVPLIGLAFVAARTMVTATVRKKRETIVLYRRRIG